MILTKEELIKMINQKISEGALIEITTTVSEPKDNYSVYSENRMVIPCFSEIGTIAIYYKQKI